MQRLSLCELRVEDGLFSVEHGYLLVSSERHPFRIEETCDKFLVVHKVVFEHLPVAVHKVHIKNSLAEQYVWRCFLSYPEILFPKLVKWDYNIPSVMARSVRQVANYAVHTVVRYFFHHFEAVPVEKIIVWFHQIHCCCEKSEISVLFSNCASGNPP